MEASRSSKKSAGPAAAALSIYYCYCIMPPFDAAVLAWSAAEVFCVVEAEFWPVGWLLYC